MAKNVTISLSFNTSNSSYSLSTSDTSLAQISADKQSYIVKGKTYTPTIDKTKNVLYRLNSWTMPSGPTVGTEVPVASISKSPNTTSDYTSSEINYYTEHTSYDYKTLSISLNPSTGVVSGDTSECEYTTDTSWDNESSTQYTLQCTATYNKELRGSYSQAFLVTWSSTGDYTGSGTWYKPTRATCTNYVFATGRRYYPVSTTATISGSGANNTFISGKFYSQSRSYYFTSVTWDYMAGTGWWRYGSATTSDTESSQRYRMSSTTYSPSFFSRFTFDASTGDITWSHRNGSTTYYNRVEDNSTFDIDDVSTYSHNSTDWNADDLTIVSQSATSITISVPTLSWSFTDKDGNQYSGDKIIFIDKNGTETTINELN